MAVHSRSYCWKIFGISIDLLLWTFGLWKGKNGQVMIENESSSQGDSLWDKYLSSTNYVRHTCVSLLGLTCWHRVVFLTVFDWRKETKNSTIYLEPIHTKISLRNMC
jgi:hypothetical protein